MRQYIHTHWAIAIILCFFPVALWALLQLQPTFDDWTYLTTPYTGKLSEVIFPAGVYWRPFDGLIGYVLGFNYHLFPALNHLIVLLGHTLAAVCVFLLCQKLKFKAASTNIATLFFYLAPGMLGTVLDIDSINQTYSALWGLIGLLLFLRYQGSVRIACYVVCCYFAVLSKENGILWFAIIPLFAWGINRLSMRCLWQFAGLAFGCILLYGIARLSLPNSGMYVNNEYYSFALAVKIKNIAKFVAVTCVPTDYVGLMRRSPIGIAGAVLTFFMAMPFYLSLFASKVRYWRERTFWMFLFCIFLGASIHLATIFTVMHAYASLGLEALLVAYLLDKQTVSKRIIGFTLLYMVSAFMIATSHWDAARAAGQLAQRMGENTLRVLKNPVDSVYSITLEDTVIHYSSFLVPPAKAFGWGRAAIHASEYRWPKEWKDTLIQRDNKAAIPRLVKLAHQKGYRCVMVYDGERMKVVSR